MVHVCLCVSISNYVTMLNAILRKIHFVHKRTFFTFSHLFTHNITHSVMCNSFLKLKMENYFVLRVFIFVTNLLYFFFFCFLTCFCVGPFQLSNTIRILNKSFHWNATSVIRLSKTSKQIIFLANFFFSLRSSFICRRRKSEFQSKFIIIGVLGCNMCTKQHWTQIVLWLKLMFL